MSFSEKPDEKQTNIRENNSIDDNNSKNQTKIIKKNRTLQYYKFLIYNMKTEIKLHDFLKLLRNSNTAELSIWTISVVLFANIPKNFLILKEGETSKSKFIGAFLWFHIMHILHACLGMYVDINY